MRYLYGTSDIPFPKEKPEKISTKKYVNPLNEYKFEMHSLLYGPTAYNKNDVPLLFKTTPDSLLNLTANIVDALPLPRAFTWTNVEVCRFIKRLGYPHYQRTFRENLIHGRSLILLDAAALSKMNIKNWDDIKRIAFFIRCLYHFEMVKFARSISLTIEHLDELYKLFRTRTGPKYELTRRTDYYRYLNIIRKKIVNLNHFDRLERWLLFEKDPNIFPELFGGTRRYNLYYCKTKKQIIEPLNLQCICSFCECQWQDEKYLALPWVLKILDSKKKKIDVVTDCLKCAPPPCTCKWKHSYFLCHVVHSALMLNFPELYSFGPRHRFSKFSDSRLSYVNFI